MPPTTPAALTRRGLVLRAAALGAAMWVPAGVARWVWALVGGRRRSDGLGLEGVPVTLQEFVRAVGIEPRPAGWRPLRVDPALAGEVVEEVARWWRAGAGAAADARREVAARVAADFAAWRVVIADHWVLSRTEVALQLLADRLHGGRG